MIRSLITVVVLASAVAGYDYTSTLQPCTDFQIVTPTKDYKPTKRDRAAIRTATRTCSRRYGTCLSKFIIVEPGTYQALCR